MTQVGMTTIKPNTPPFAICIIIGLYLDIRLLDFAKTRSRIEILMK
jgi:hypothetical protein